MIRLVRRVEMPVPTLAGWGVVVVILLSVSVVFIGTVHPFLAVDQPLGSGSLVVEGWMSRKEVLDTITLFESEGYDRIYTTGGPIPQGSYLALLYPNHKTHAEIAANQFRQAGVTEDRVVAAPRGLVVSHRTYFSALALRLKLVADGLVGRQIDILTAGTHARRSRLLYQAALEDVAKVGVKAIPPTSYDPDRWWTSSSGVRTVIGETIAYCYAKFLFYPNIERDIAQLELAQN